MIWEAPEVVRVVVTDEDIAGGNLGHACSCPVALAVDRAVKGWGFNASAVTNAIRVHRKDNGVEVMYRPPKAAWKFMHRFDDSLPVMPFEFLMERA